MEKEVLSGMESKRLHKVTPFKEGGILIELEGYPIECIRLVVDYKHNCYDFVIREKQGHIYRVEKEISGELVSASIKKLYKKNLLCT